MCQRTIERDTAVKSVTWMPGGEGNAHDTDGRRPRADQVHSAFLSVEAGGVALVDLAGNEVDMFPFDRLEMHDVSVTPDGEYHHLLP